MKIALNPMARGLAAVALTALLSAAGGAEAQVPQTAYSWIGMGTGSGSKCSTYKMEIDVTVEGSSVKGLFQQQGREQRHFEAVADAKGAFKTKATVGGGGSMDVSGSIKDGDSNVVLDGYCKFGGKLIRK